MGSFGTQEENQEIPYSEHFYRCEELVIDDLDYWITGFEYLQP
jgi:hypothetical protein